VTGRERLLLVAVAAALVATPLRAYAVLCRAKNDAVFVREACKRKETVVDLSKGDPGPNAVSTLRAYAVDATGKRIGFVSATGYIVMTRGNVGIRAIATVDGFLKVGGLYFEAPGCAGTPLVPASSSVVYLPLVIVGASGYYGGGSVATRTLQSAAVSTTAQGCMSAGQTYDPASGVCCSNFTSPSQVSAAVAIPIDISEFVPPFGVELER